MGFAEDLMAMCGGQTGMFDTTGWFGKKIFAHDKKFIILQHIEKDFFMAIELGTTYPSPIVCIKKPADNTKEGRLNTMLWKK